MILMIFEELGLKLKFRLKVKLKSASSALDYGLF